MRNECKTMFRNLKEMRSWQDNDEIDTKDQFGGGGAESI
jgi:hypothetical protein